MASKAPAVRTYERNFGHCIVSWKIKNFSLAACNSGTEIRTSEFTVSSLKVTHWQIGFRIESERNKLQLFLKRLDDETDDSFKVTWKIKILNGKGEGTFVSEKLSFIHKNAEFLVDTVCPLEILGALPTGESDEVKMEFQMIVHMNTSLELPKPSNEELISLSNDLSVVAKQGLHSDVNVVLNGKLLKAHKAVICPRSERLSQSARYKNKNIQLYLSDINAINSLFAYLYTGDLRYIFNPPSISVYDYIVHLDIKELEDSYPREKITLETVIEATKFEFRWTIQNFSNCDAPQDSEIYEEDGMEAKWQLRIYPKGLTEGTEVQKKYVYIEALALECQRSQDVYLDFITRNDKGLIMVAKRTYGKVNSGAKLGVLFMRIGGFLMAKSVVGNVLNIYFSVHTATEKINSTITETSPPMPFKLTNSDTYRILANYMDHVHSANLYSDVTLVVEGKEFKAHKFLLAGRSITFSRMVHGMKDDITTLPINNMKKHAFRIFLDYLYTADLKDNEVDEVMQVYSAAVRFLVKPLENVCLQVIAEHISPMNACFLLLYAHDRRFNSLKNEALKHIDVYRDYIIDSESWSNLEKKNPELFYEAITYLADRPTGHSVHGLNDQQRVS